VIGVIPGELNQGHGLSLENAGARDAQGIPLAARQ
jgi:hypothetical protein